MNYLFLFVGAFVGSLIYQEISDRRFLKLFKTSSERSRQLAHQLVVSKTTNVIDALFTASALTALGLFIEWII